MNEPKEIHCYDCNKDWLWTPNPTGYTYRPDRCPDCEIEFQRMRLEESRSRLLKSLNDDTPPRYQATDTSHADFNVKLWNAIKSWRPTDEKPWLGLIGPSGKCKTRCAFLLLHDIVKQDFDQSTEPADRRRTIDFECVESYTISRAFIAQYDNDFEVKNPAKVFLKRIRRADLLILDDFGKAKNTPAFSAELFAILDHRHAHNLTTIWTANSKPEDLVAGMSEDMAGPLAGRLIECSRIVTIK